MSSKPTKVLVTLVGIGTAQKTIFYMTQASGFMRSEEIDFLFKKSGEVLVVIKKLYSDNLIKKNIKDNEFRIEILFYLVCFRVILDYLMKDVVDFYEINVREDKKNFPILSFEKYSIDGRGESIRKFNDWDIVKFIKNKNIALYEYIFSIQCFNGQEKEWCGRFLDLVNYNKHDKLTPNIIKNNESIKYKGVRFGSIITCTSGMLSDGQKVLVPPNTYLTPNNLDGLKSKGEVSSDFQREKWDSIHFDNIIDLNIVDFLEKISNEIRGVKDAIYCFLSKK